MHRLRPGKTEVRIYDYVDREIPTLRRMFEKRLRGYRAIGYARDEESPGAEKSKGELLIDWDKKAPRGTKVDF